MMCADIWHRIGDIEAGMPWQFSPELTKKSKIIYISVLWFLVYL